MRVSITWPPSTIHGWGVYAINLALQWSLDPDIEFSMPSGEVMIDPLRAGSIKRVNWQPDEADVFLHGLGNDFLPEPTTPRDRTIGVIFFEEPLTDAAVERAKRYPLIITGSTWNERLLRDVGLSNVRTIFQGVDRSLFHAAPKIGLFRDRFAIFSGGKAEYRKGQDIVLAAFKRFAAEHPEALLVTAWHSPFPHLAKTLDQSGLCTPVPTPFDSFRWAVDNDINPDQFIDIGIVHNTMMPQVYRECDCAIFPNRSEGGTNLVAMEAMACGVKTALTCQSGHEDLSPDIWIDESVESAVDAMERLPRHTHAIGLNGFTWAETAMKLKLSCKDLLSCATIAA